MLNNDIFSKRELFLIFILFCLTFISSFLFREHFLLISQLLISFFTLVVIIKLQDSTNKLNMRLNKRIIEKLENVNRNFFYGEPPEVEIEDVIKDSEVLLVTTAVQPADGYAVKGAQRVPYTTFVLTAGREDVVVSNVRVKKFGLGSRNNIENVALVDSNGVLLTKSRTLNSNDEAVLVGNFEVPANRSVTVTVVGNVATGDKVKSGAVVGFEVLEVNATERVTGDLPLRGAAHVLSNAVNLQKITVKSDSSSNSEVRLNREEDLGTYSLKFTSTGVSGSGADSEDGYLRSITFEQKGNANINEVGRVVLLADGREADYSLEIQGNRWVFIFDAPGLFIKDGETLNITLQTETSIGSGSKIEFAIQDESDVYVVGRSYGYGLPVSAFTGKNSNLVSSIIS